MRLVLAFVAAFVAAIPARAETPLPSFEAPLMRDHVLVGKLWLPATQRFATPDEVVELARAADAVLLGETHDNADHHALQAWMTARLMESGRPPLVAFEMIDAGQEKALRRHLADHPGDAAGLGPALSWEKSAWPSWSLYRPIAEAALRAGAALAPANLTREQVGDIARHGDDHGLPPISRQQLASIGEDIKDGHCGMLPDTAVPGMVRVQRSRDKVMAETLIQGMHDHGHAILIAGAGHTRTDRGVPVALSQLAPTAKAFSVGFLEVKDGMTDPAAYGERFGTRTPPFDAVWFTPAAEREDQCEAFRRHMEKKKGKGA